MTLSQVLQTGTCIRGYSIRSEQKLHCAQSLHIFSTFNFQTCTHTHTLKYNISAELVDGNFKLLEMSQKKIHSRILTKNWTGLYEYKW